MQYKLNNDIANSIIISYRLWCYILCSYCAGRDETLFSNPEKFDPKKDNEQTRAFAMLAQEGVMIRRRFAELAYLGTGQLYSMQLVARYNILYLKVALEKNDTVQYYTNELFKDQSS